MKGFLIGLLRLFLSVAVSFSAYAQGEDKTQSAEAQSEDAIFAMQVFVPAKEKGFFSTTDIKLETTLYRPRGAGPFPLFILNHGSTGNGAIPESRTSKEDRFSAFLLRHNFIVLVPMRKGRGASGGSNNESENTGCNPSVNESGVKSAVEDLDAVIAYAKTRPDVDMSRIVVGGFSRGGLLSVVYASRRPDLNVKGTVNFVGGWSNDGCVGINDQFFHEAGASKIPSLWIYGERDSNYSDESIKAYAHAFDRGNGNLEFHLYPNIPQNGHWVPRYSALWGDVLDDFLTRVGFPRR